MGIQSSVSSEAARENAGRLGHATRRIEFSPPALLGRIYEVFGAICVALMVLYSMNFRLEVNWRGASLAVMAGAMGIVGALCYVLAMARGPVALIVTFTALYPILSIVLAWLMLGETISLRQGMGIVLDLIAMVLIAT